MDSAGKRQLGLARPDIDDLALQTRGRNFYRLSLALRPSIKFFSKYKSLDFVSPTAMCAI